MKRLLQLSIPLALLLVVVMNDSCKKEEIKEVIAGFSYQIDLADFKTVHFTNASQNFSEVAWDFGDGSAISKEEDPSHTYADVGTYTVKITATSTDGKETDFQTQTVTITDPNAELSKLVGDVSKTWILLREVEPGVLLFPLEVGPIDYSTIWWAQGYNNDELALRPCILNDEYVFFRNGDFQYKTNGDYWAEGGVFDPANACRDSDPANMTGPGGSDLSAFGDGTHKFRLDLTTPKRLTVIGYGAYIGLPKIATDAEVSVPQDSVTLDIVKLAEGSVADTLILVSEYKWDPANTEDNAYWKITLVSYHNPNDTPPLPGPKPVASFTATTNGLTATFTNTTSGAADSYAWDFGDGGTSTDANPTHTYATGGAYIVSLTAANVSGSTTATLELFMNDAAMTDADLQGAGWKIRVAENSIFVGPGLGDGSWWKTPLSFLDGSSTGADDWSCMTNDEFIFSAGGVYEYKTNGDLRNDGYMGSPNGCITDAELAAIGGNAAAFGSGIHSYTFTPASGTDRPIIELTNGASGAAFLGFYKGYYGGENTDGANPPNGGNLTNKYEVIGYAKSATKETLFVSVDISADHSGTAAWSCILER